MSTIRCVVGSVLLLSGSAVFLISLLGVFRFRYVLNRIHATAVSDTLGTLLTLSGLMVLRGPSFATAKLALILVTMWFTGPLSTHRIGGVEATTNLSVHEEYEVTQ